MENIKTIYFTMATWTFLSILILLWVGQQNSNAFYGRQFREPRRGGNSDFDMTIWHF